MLDLSTLQFQSDFMEDFIYNKIKLYKKTLK